MVTYRFCMASTGTIMCYKYGDGFRQYNGNSAIKLLDHIKKYGFFNYNAKTNKKNNKFTYDMQFTSANHRVTFEDVHSFKSKNEMSIENEIESLINIVKKNKAIINAEKKRKENIFKGISTFTATISLAVTMIFTSKSYNKEKQRFNDNINTITTYSTENKGVKFIKSNVKSAYAEQIADEAIKSTISDNNYLYTKSKIDTNKPIVSGEEVFVDEENQETINIEKYVEDYYNENLNATTINTSKIEEEVADALTNIIEETAGEYDGNVLNSRDGVIHNGPGGGKETYYDLNMDKVVQNMRNQGFDEETYPYWVREDGVKMIGDYVMVAANLNVHPRGSIVATSLGVGMVCDTGDFAKGNTLQLDIATNWTRGK